MRMQFIGTKQTLSGSALAILGAITLGGGLLAGAADEPQPPPSLAQETSPAMAPPTAQEEIPPAADTGDVHERAVIRDHRKTPGTFTPSRSTTPPSVQPPQKLMVPGVVGPLTGTLALPDRYTAPTPGLTMVANAIKLQSNSLTTVLAIPPGLRLAVPIEINVEYLSPAAPLQTIAQLYTPVTGSRLVRQDLVGDGKPRRQFMKITLIERSGSGTGAQFKMDWQVDLDPLFNVEVGSLRFTLLDDCDWAGKSEVQLAWVKPDKSVGTWNVSRRKGQLVTVSDFAWSGRAVGSKSGHVRPYAIFKESDLCVTLDCLFGLHRPFSPEQNLPPLIPGQTEAATVTKTPEGGGSCRAQLTYPIVYTLYVDPALAQPTSTPPSGGGTYRASADFGGVQGNRGWYYQDSLGRLMTFNSAQNLWQGAEMYLTINNNSGHPGNGADAVRRWVAPSAGTVRITGVAFDLDLGGGGGVIVSIRKGGTMLWQQAITNGNTSGYSFNISTSVVPGEAIDFVISQGPDGNNSYDSTAFDPTISY